MQATNDEPDAVNIPGTTLPLENVQVDELTEEQEQKSSEIDANNTTHMKSYRAIIDYYNFVGSLKGMKIVYRLDLSKVYRFINSLCSFCLRVTFPWHTLHTCIVLTGLMFEYSNR